MKTERIIELLKNQEVEKGFVFSIGMGVVKVSHDQYYDTLYKVTTVCGNVIHLHSLEGVAECLDMMY